ncbi:MAG: DUF1565 domain-containing protein [Bacteroidales bacterium]|nr:DUF1565 domain-containing protein [Bacteroidales bacterium]
MKKKYSPTLLILIIIFSFYSCEKASKPEITKLFTGADYYVATNGNDANPGTYTSPFATWQKAFDVAKAGDTVYIRGGTYYPDVTIAYGVRVYKHNGKKDSLIHIFAYPGEKPILDMSKNTNGSTNNYGINLNTSSYWHLKGLEVIGASQHGKNMLAAGIRLSDSNNNILEQISSHDNQGLGIDIIGASEDNLIINCDSYNNYDPYTTIPGGNADGFQIAFIAERNGDERINTIRGCRAWYNSDDGFDCWRNDGIVIIDSCWSFNNGRDQGNGGGFKLGATDGTPETVPQRIITNCLAVNNRQIGFYNNGTDVLMSIFNNTSYKNGNRGFSFYTDDIPIIVRNNLSYNNAQTDMFLPNALCDHNSWDLNVTVTNSDFISLEYSQLNYPRKINGNLPDITFLNLKTGSDLINAGVIVGLPYDEKSPDVGAFEFWKITFS